MPVTITGMTSSPLLLAGRCLHESADAIAAQTFWLKSFDITAVTCILRAFVARFTIPFAARFVPGITARKSFVCATPFTTLNVPVNLVRAVNGCCCCGTAFKNFPIDANWFSIRLLRYGHRSNRAQVFR